MFFVSLFDYQPRAQRMTATSGLSLKVRELYTRLWGLNNHRAQCAVEKLFLF